MEDVFECLKRELEEGRHAVLLTVIASTGSTPRSAGSHQLVLADGTTVGTIGGGIAEYKACEEGKHVLQTGCSTIVSYILHPNDAADIGAVCGGETNVFCQFLSPSQPNVLSCLTQITTARRQHIPAWLVLDVTVPQQWAMGCIGQTLCVCGADETSRDLKQVLEKRPCWLYEGSGLAENEDACWYREPLAYEGRVFVFGGGHVAKALVPVLTQVGFSCVVVDDREEFANAVQFPQAEQTIVADFSDLSAAVQVTCHDYVCIMTRGHIGDYEVQRQMLACHPYYLGVIGSRTKLAFVRNKLRKDGFTDDEIDACHAPIGLPISAVTPEEIAVSIAAELIAVRARREGREKGDARQWRSADVPSVRIPT